MREWAPRLRALEAWAARAPSPLPPASVLCKGLSLESEDSRLSCGLGSRSKSGHPFSPSPSLLPCCVLPRAHLGGALGSRHNSQRVRTLWATVLVPHQRCDGKGWLVWENQYPGKQVGFVPPGTLTFSKLNPFPMKGLQGEPWRCFCSIHRRNSCLRKSAGQG